MEEKLLQLIKESHKILITSHISPDPDAVSSVLLLGLTLRLSFPDKEVAMVLEDQPSGLDFLDGFDQIQFQSLNETLKETKPDLFFMLDGNNYERGSRHDGQVIREFIKTSSVKTVIIDHHEPAGKDNADLYFNRNSPATAQDVYELCFSGLSLKRPPNAAQTAMVGFYADTGGFVYAKDGRQNQVFSFAEKLVNEGANIEKAKNSLENYTEADLLVLKELLENITAGPDYSYSFLDDQFIDRWLSGGQSYAELQRPTNTFLNNYIRNIEARPWGFTVYKNTLQGEGYYTVSLRSQGGSPDVSLIAVSLGGGGHKPAAGAKFEASSIQEAIEKVKSAIASS